MTLATQLILLAMGIVSMILAIVMRNQFFAVMAVVYTCHCATIWQVGWMLRDRQTKDQS